MAHKFYSRISYPSDGATKVYAIPFLSISPSTIHVFVGAAEKVQGVDYTVGPGAASIVLLQAPHTGQRVVIRRITPRQDPSMVSAPSLYLLYSLQELLDDSAENGGANGGFFYTIQSQVNQITVSQ